MNRRYVLKNRRRFFTFVVIAIIALSYLSLAAVARGADAETAYKTVVVRQGDTLWDIAKEYGNGRDPRQYIRYVEELNQITDDIIREGDILKIPA